MTEQKQKIAFQGEPGANSHMACQAARPDLEPLPCQSFEDMLEAVKTGEALLAMVPVENSVAGRVADIHHLLPESGLYIIGEHYQRINAMLLGVPGAKISDVKEIRSHVHALAQSRKLMAELGAKPVQHADTAGAARFIAEQGDKSIAAIGPRLAAELYGLDILRESVEDAEHNTTRFLIMAREGIMPPADNGPCVTTIIFRVRSVPAALYKALGGFATNGINLTKLESYLVDGKFTAAQFYVDAEGHPEETPLKLALEELHFFCPKGAVRILGTYPAHKFRIEQIINGPVA
ncbi:prephenate dehydratase [Nisaea acidiphila]|uniref:prephenate dehydratase n=1 Tax=Nisaea acidiphila TaxID=1862145 RepID=A0A9J7ANN2_9PROT|nr:prephenate dehydratase [Nisaea acidiphila]UUX48201.1 prephenate dehydratase [Nisaea acidiphila]